MSDAPHTVTPDPGREALADALRVSFRLLIGVMSLVAAAYLLSGWFIVQEHQRAYVLVMGRISGVGAERIKGPGLHWTWPKPIAEVVRVPAERIQSIEVQTHWFEELPGAQWDMEMRDVGATLRPARDGYLLTGDANIIHARWGIRFTVRDPESYLFEMADPESMLRLEMDRAAARVAQRWTVDAVLRADIEGFRAEVDQELRRRLHDQAGGIQLHRLDLLAIIPPRQVASAFESVIEAEQDRSRAMSAARAYAARASNEAEGDAARTRSEALAARQRIISEAEADAEYFTAVLTAFHAHPDLIPHTLWQDRMRPVFGRVESQFVVRDRPGGGQELRLHIGPPPRP